MLGAKLVITMHRIKIKIGNSEFDAEGEPELVQSQYEAFLAALKSNVTTSPSVIADTQHQPSQRDFAPGYIDSVADRIFVNDDTLSLLALPKTDNAVADALILLLYGYHRLRSERSVTGSALMKSAKQSGAKADRIDRFLDMKKEFVNSAGNRRGRRYSLNNRGMSEAENLIQGMLS